MGMLNYISEKIYPLFYKSKPDFELSDIDKQLKKDGTSDKRYKKK